MTTRINTKIFVKAINNAASLTADPYRYVTHPKLLLKLTRDHRPTQKLH